MFNPILAPHVCSSEDEQTWLRELVTVGVGFQYWPQLLCEYLETELSEIGPDGRCCTKVNDVSEKESD